MTRRFRVVAGPNGSGKTTLMRRLAAGLSVTVMRDGSIVRIPPPIELKGDER